MGRTLLLICAVVVALGLAGAGEQPRNPTKRAAGPDHEQENFTRPPEDSRALLDIARAIERSGPAPETAEEKQDAKDDVKAQRDMAFWALIMGLGTIAQLGVGVVGTIFLIKSVNQGKDGLETARQSNQLAARQFEMGFKPWLVCTMEGWLQDRNSIEMFKEGQTGVRPVVYSFYVKYECAGDMPATITDFRFQLLGHGPVYPPLQPVFEVLSKGEAIIFGQWPRDRYDCPYRQGDVQGAAVIEMTRENRIELMQSPPILVAQIQYLDPLGKRRLLSAGFQPTALWSREIKRAGGETYNFEREI